MVFLLPPMTSSDDTDPPQWESAADSQYQSFSVIGTQNYTEKKGRPANNLPFLLRQPKTLVNDALGNASFYDVPSALKTIQHLLNLSRRHQVAPSLAHLVTINDIANLDISHGSIEMQPSRGWAYVNKPVYLQSDTHSVTKETTILGYHVTITASPISYTWHCGDGSVFTTTDGGGHWPHGTVTHSYTRAGRYTLSVETTWRATYTVNGVTYPIEGTLTSTSTPIAVNIIEAEGVLTR